MLNIEKRNKGLKNFEIIVSVKQVRSAPDLMESTVWYTHFLPFSFNFE